MKGTRRLNIPIRQNNTMIETPTIQGIGDPPLKDVFPTNDQTNDEEEIEPRVEFDPETGHYFYYWKLKYFKHRPEFGFIYGLRQVKPWEERKYEILGDDDFKMNLDYDLLYKDDYLIKEILLPGKFKDLSDELTEERYLEEKRALENYKPDLDS